VRYAEDLLGHAFSTCSIKKTKSEEAVGSMLVRNWDDQRESPICSRERDYGDIHLSSKTNPMLVVSSFAVVAALLAVFIAMPVSARAAMPSSAHRISGVAAARVNPSVWSSQPNLGPNVYIFNPSMPPERDPGDSRRSSPNRSPTSSGRSATHYCSSLAPMDPVATRSAFRLAITPPWRPRALCHAHDGLLRRCLP